MVDRSKIEMVYKNVSISEGINIIYDFLANAYIYPDLSVREMANLLNLPIPVVSAIKNELKKNNIVDIKRGICLSSSGERFVEEQMGYKNIDLKFLDKIYRYEQLNLKDFRNEISELEKIYENRPTVNVEIDQSMCKAETGIKRAILLLKSKCLIGKKIACIGDDDLISMAILLVANRIAISNKIEGIMDITVFDIDERILDYISEVSKNYGTNIKCVKHDFSNPIDLEYRNIFDCVITDPPYTVNGMNLFLNRGISVLKKESNLTIFLSFAHKTPQIRFLMQKSFVEMGLILSDIYPKFNEYIGAQILGGVSDLIVLNTTQYTLENISNKYTNKIYTGQFKVTHRVYECKNCKARYLIGLNEKIKTIEQLKKYGCKNCSSNKFNILKNK